jgi:hypothetical protein
MRCAKPKAVLLSRQPQNTQDPLSKPSEVPQRQASSIETRLDSLTITVCDRVS